MAVGGELSATEWSLGLNENRGGTLVDTGCDELVRRGWSIYLETSVAFERCHHGLAGLTRSWARFARKRPAGNCSPEPILRCQVRRFLAKPFDLQWAYVETTGKLWNESRSALVSQAARQPYVLARCRSPRAFEGMPLLRRRPRRPACAAQGRIPDTTAAQPFRGQRTVRATCCRPISLGDGREVPEPVTRAIAYVGASKAVPKLGDGRRRLAYMSWRLAMPRHIDRQCRWSPPGLASRSPPGTRSAFRLGRVRREFRRTSRRRGRSKRSRCGSLRRELRPSACLPRR